MTILIPPPNTAYHVRLKGTATPILPTPAPAEAVSHIPFGQQAVAPIVTGAAVQQQPPVNVVANQAQAFYHVPVSTTALPVQEQYSQQFVHSAAQHSVAQAPQQMGVYHAPALPPLPTIPQFAPSQPVAPQPDYALQGMLDEVERLFAQKPVFTTPLTQQATPFSSSSAFTANSSATSTLQNNGQLVRNEGSNEIFKINDPNNLRNSGQKLYGVLTPSTSTTVKVETKYVPVNVNRSLPKGIVKAVNALNQSEEDIIAFEKYRPGTTWGAVRSLGDSIGSGSFTRNHESEKARIREAVLLHSINSEKPGMGVYYGHEQTHQEIEAHNRMTFDKLQRHHQNDETKGKYYDIMIAKPMKAGKKSKEGVKTQVYHVLFSHLETALNALQHVPVRM